MPTSVNAAMPFTTVAVAVPIMVPLLLTVMVTKAVLVVTVLPLASLMVITGWVVNAEPLTLPAAEVLSIAWFAVPVVGVMVWVAEVKPAEVKVRV